MKHFLRIGTAVMAGVLLVISCRPVISEYRPEDYSLSPNSSEYNFTAIFEGFWSGINRNYVFWEVDSTDWDAVYDEYKPKFDALGVFPAAKMDDPSFPVACNAAYSYFKEMTKDISDGHFRIDFEPSLTQILSQADKYSLTNAPMVRHTLDRMEERPGFVELDGLFINNNWTSDNSTKPTESKDAEHRYSFDYFNNIIAVKYSMTNVKSGVVPMMIPGLPLGTGGWPAFESNFRAGTGRIPITGSNEYILYFHFTNFGLYTIKSGMFDGLGSLASSLQSSLTAVKDVIDQFLDDLADPNMKGVIVDLRGNYGGDYRDWDLLWKRMIDSPLRFADVRTKSGEGRLDYGPWTPFVIDSHKPGKRLHSTSVPVVALVDKFTGSAAELSTLIVKAMPNGHVIGERTMGSISPMGGDNRVFNGGQFNGGKFWTHVTCAFLEVRDLDGRINEKVGIPPDEEVPADWDAFFRFGRDIRLEAAIHHIDPDHDFKD
jgi:hypothetical protein